MIMFFMLCDKIIFFYDNLFFKLLINLKMSSWNVLVLKKNSLIKLIYNDIK